MAKPRRNVQFQHRGNSAHDGRRPSVSDVSEGGASEPGSPMKSGMNGKSDLNHEEVSLSYIMEYATTRSIIS